MVLFSGIDLVSHVFTYWLVSISARPADYRHNYGYGKFENLCAMGIALAIIVTAGLGIYEAVEKLIHPHASVDFGLVALAASVSCLKDAWVSRLLRRTVEQAPSAAVEYTADHLGFKAVIDGSVAAALAASAVLEYALPETFFTKHIACRVDPVVALALQAFVIENALAVIRESLLVLLDRTLPEDMQMVIVRALTRFHTQYCQFGKVRSRRSGQQIFIDLEIVYNADWSLAAATAAAGALAADLRREIASTEIAVYPVACAKDCFYVQNGRPCPYTPLTAAPGAQRG